MGFWQRLFGGREPPKLEALEKEEGGERFIQVAYHDGKRHGPYRRFRRDGSLLEEGTYDHGEREGAFVIHARDRRIEGAYRAGKLHGVHRELAVDGSVLDEREYADGEVVNGP